MFAPRPKAWLSAERDARDPPGRRRAESSEHRDQMREALVGIARARTGPPGGLCLEAEVVVVVGTRPTQTRGGEPIREEQP
jgi:hypothetical protein